MNKTEPQSARHAKDISNDELPILLSNDTLGCPRCCIELTNRKSKLSVGGTTMGMFDSMACELCGFFLLTEKGFDESAKVIKLCRQDMPK